MQSSIASVVQYIPGTQVANIGLPTAQQNFANARNSASSFDDAQGTNFNPAQHGSVSDVLQRGSTDECMQGALNPQLSYHNWTSMQPSNAIQANAIILQQRKRKDMERMRHRQELLRKHQRESMKRRMQLNQRQFMPQDSDKPLSNSSSLTNNRQAVHHQHTLVAPETPVVKTPGPGASALLPLLSEFKSPDGSQDKVQPQVPIKSGERPLDCLLKKVSYFPTSYLPNTFVIPF